MLLTGVGRSGGDAPVLEPLLPPELLDDTLPVLDDDDALLPVLDDDDALLLDDELPLLLDDETLPELLEAAVGEALVPPFPPGMPHAPTMHSSAPMHATHADPETPQVLVEAVWHAPEASQQPLQLELSQLDEPQALSSAAAQRHRATTTLIRVRDMGFPWLGLH